MFVVLAYDVKSKKGARVLKACRKYLRHVQKSVFEGTITDAELYALKQELAECSDSECDSIRLYEFGSVRYAALETLGPCLGNPRII